MTKNEFQMTRDMVCLSKVWIIVYRLV
jgi:hypothetical protein